jgi:hypothetical protein
VDRETAPVKSALSGPNHEPRSPNVELIGFQSVRAAVELPWAADSCPCVEKLRTVLPLTVGIRDSAVPLVLTHRRRGRGQLRALALLGHGRAGAVAARVRASAALVARALAGGLRLALRSGLHLYPPRRLRVRTRGWSAAWRATCFSCDTSRPCATHIHRIRWRMGDGV